MNDEIKMIFFLLIVWLSVRVYLHIVTWIDLKSTKSEKKNHNHPIKGYFINFSIHRLENEEDKMQLDDRNIFCLIDVHIIWQKLNRFDLYCSRLHHFTVFVPLGMRPIPFSIAYFSFTIKHFLFTTFICDVFL